MNKILSLLLLCTSFQSLADSTYIGVDYMLNEIEFDDDSAKPKATALRLGVSNNQMAFELQYLMNNNLNVTEPLDSTSVRKHVKHYRCSTIQT
jgi:hypothetical protein